MGKFSNSERRLRLALFMRKNNLSRSKLAEKTGYSKQYITFALSRPVLSAPLRLSLLDAGIPDELMQPQRGEQEDACCVHSEQKICDSQAQ